MGWHGSVDQWRPVEIGPVPAQRDVVQLLLVRHADQARGLAGGLQRFRHDRGDELAPVGDRVGLEHLDLWVEASR
jgi:hypothetical protein